MQLGACCPRISFRSQGDLRSTVPISGLPKLLGLCSTSLHWGLVLLGSLIQGWQARRSLGSGSLRGTVPGLGPCPLLCELCRTTQICFVPLWGIPTASAVHLALVRRMGRRERPVPGHHFSLSVAQLICPVRIFFKILRCIALVTNESREASL